MYMSPVTSVRVEDKIESTEKKEMKAVVQVGDTPSVDKNLLHAKMKSPGSDDYISGRPTSDTLRKA
jgi:hypothetical protein